MGLSDLITQLPELIASGGGEPMAGLHRDLRGDVSRKSVPADSF